QLRDHLYAPDEELEYEARAPERAALTAEIHAKRQAHLESYVSGKAEAFRLHSAEDAPRDLLADPIELEEMIKEDSLQWKNDNEEFMMMIETRELEMKRGILKDDRVRADPLEPTRIELAKQERATQVLETQLEKM